MFNSGERQKSTRILHVLTQDLEDKYNTVQGKCECPYISSLLETNCNFTWLYTGLQVTRCKTISVSLTKCPLTLWLNFNIACNELYIDSEGHKVSSYQITSFLSTILVCFTLHQAALFLPSSSTIAVWFPPHLP